MRQNNRQHFIFNLIAISIVYALGLFAQINDYIRTGSLLVISALYGIVYLLFFKVARLKRFHKWLKYDQNILLVLTSLICFFGMIDSYPNFWFALVFAELFVFVYVYAYFKFRNKNTGSMLQKWGLFRFCFRMFFIAVTVLLILSILYEHEVSSQFLDPYYFVLLLALLIDVLVNHLRSTVQLKNEQTQAELLHLRSQLSPHFFFNTLNNLYALTLKNSKQAPAVILKLSEMMRYTIYEGEKQRVRIKDEIAYLENYIELHKIRYKDPVLFEFKHSIDTTLTIAPLLFINLLENAFKHGVESLTEKAFVNINLTNDAEFIYFSIENNFDEKADDTPKGIGLINLKRRLSLLYPKTHALAFSKDKNLYTATLKVSI